MINLTENGVQSLIKLIEVLVHNKLTPARVTSTIASRVGTDADLMYALRVMYDPLIKFYYRLPYESYELDYAEIIGKPVNTDILNTTLNTLASRTANRATQQAMVDTALADNPLIALFLRKTLDLGFGISGAKKLGIIDAHSPQKGVLLQDVSELRYPVYADLKYNGTRLSVIVGLDGEVTCKLLRGQIIKIPLLETILSTYKGKTFDGELVSTLSPIPYYVGGVSERDRITLNGRITSATANNEPFSMQDVGFVVYDLLESSHFVRAKRTTKTLESRREELISIVKRIGSAVVTHATFWIINTPGELKQLIDWTVSVGGEGLMIKSPSSTYDYAKNKQWLKVKGIKECDLEICDYKVHSRNPNWIGSLVCRGTIDNKLIKVNVGSGLNDRDRDIALFDRYYKGSIVCVTYMDVVSKRGGTFSLSNPRFYKDSVNRRLVEILRQDGNSTNY